jgi:GNAT superfamily N-acetyltransferase
MTLIRRVNVGDASHAAWLVDALLVELSGSVSRYDARLATANRLLTLQDRIFGFVATEDEDPIGVILLSESASIYAGGMFGVITELYVVPKERSGGLAKKLVDAAAALGRERSWGRIEVGAPHQPAWERSLKFYLSNGFIEIGPRLQLLL